jgi:hypothetical protein
MYIEIEFSFDVVGTELAEADRIEKSAADMGVEEGSRNGLLTEPHPKSR